MAWKLFSNQFGKASCPIAIDFGRQHLRMLQLEARGEAWAVVASGSECMPAAMPTSGAERVDLLAGALRRLVAGGEFRGKRCVSCLPAAAVQYKNLRIPRMPADEMKAAVEWEAADRLNFAADSMSLQFYDAGEVRQGEEQREEVILLAAPKQTVDEYAAAMVAAGLQPVCVESVPCALNRLAARMLSWQSPEDIHVVLDIGYGSSKVLICRQGRVMFFKLIDMGGQQLDERVGKQLGLSQSEAAALRQRTIGAADGGEDNLQNQPKFGELRRDSLDRTVAEAVRAMADEIAKEVSLCLRYFSVTFRGRRPESIWLIGGETNDAQIAKLLAEGTGIQVTPWTLADKIDCGAILTSPQRELGGWATAMGLALWTPPLPMQKRGAA